MSYPEFVEWQKYYIKEPFAQDRTEYQIANLSYMISAYIGGKSERNDFLISNKEVKKEIKIEDKLNAIFGRK